MVSLSLLTRHQQHMQAAMFSCALIILCIFPQSKIDLDLATQMQYWTTHVGMGIGHVMYSQYVYHKHMIKATLSYVEQNLP